VILCIRTDQPEAMVAVCEKNQVVAEQSWYAHRELAASIHLRIDEVLSSVQCSLDDLTYVVVYRGPGSFTGLRIGIAVANALAYSLSVPIASTTSERWLADVGQLVAAAQPKQWVVPEYGQPPTTTSPRK
jgi:tRNA threonylcarbamoyladenosine biosynthesis protein TsaB